MDKLYVRKNGTNEAFVATEILLEKPNMTPISEKTFLELKDAFAAEQKASSEDVRSVRIAEKHARMAAMLTEEEKANAGISAPTAEEVEKAAIAKEEKAQKEKEEAESQTKANADAIAVKNAAAAKAREKEVLEKEQAAKKAAAARKKADDNKAKKEYTGNSSEGNK